MESRQKVRFIILFNDSNPSAKDTYLGQDSPGDQEAGAVGGGIVGQPDLDAVFREFVSVSGLDDHVSVNTGIRYLTDDVLVGKSNDQSERGLRRWKAKNFLK